MASTTPDQQPYRPYVQEYEQAALEAHLRRTTEDSSEHTLELLEPGMSVLDVGCGPGTITLDLAEVVAPGRVIGVEKSEGPLVAARKAAAERGDTTTQFLHADALNLPFGDNEFDLVHSHQLLRYSGNPVGALREMIRVTKPGGHLTAREADFGAFAWYPEVPALDRWRELYQALAHEGEREANGGRHLRKWANEAGLKTTYFSATCWNYADTQTCRWWGSSQAERAEADTFRRRAMALGATEEELDAIPQAWRDWAEHPDAWFAVPHGELVARID